MPMPRILVLDDDGETCRFMTELLASPGRDLRTSQDPDEALALARERPFDLVISDINLGARQNGLDVLRHIRASSPDCRVVLISGFGTLETAIDAVRHGAFDYISKPFNIAEVKATVERALARTSAGPAAGAAPPAIVPPPGLLGRTAAMLAVYKQIAHAADTTAPVLIVGESGTGKELVARAIHEHGRRAQRPFVPINCGAITETLLESELFGHVRGAFTGAVSDARGLFEQAQGGTIFLDEIGETSPALQVKLLRVLQEGEVRPVGSTRVVRVDARVVAATNVDLEREVADGRFRQDLFYRLGVLVIRMPALRDRREDIPRLVDRFLQTASARAGRRVTLSPAALERLVQYRWPGNVRELENTVERLVLMNRDAVIHESDLPFAPSAAGPPLQAQLFADLPSLDEVDRRYLVHVLDAVGGNRTRAAEIMGIDRRTLYRMAERFGVVLSEEDRTRGSA
jgi:DNA-binding NtrC family response regulator